MKRCLILIGNEGKASNGSFLPGVSKDLEAYENFFRSDNGGAWGSSEIATRRIGWTSLGLKNELLLRRMEEGGLDYALIVFSGHGYAERDGEPLFELSENDVISLSAICSILPAQKMLMIADSCQGYLNESLAKASSELRQFSNNLNTMTRDRKREIYNRQIERMGYRSKVFASAVRPGEYAGDTSQGGRYSRALLDAAETLKLGGNPDTLYNIDLVHAIAADNVSYETHDTQHPTVTPASGIEFPPFVVV